MTVSNNSTLGDLGLFQLFAFNGPLKIWIFFSEIYSKSFSAVKYNKPKLNFVYLDLQ